MINTQWLQTFITLVEVGHFTQTAEKLFMTQPGVSQHIKKLEEQAGTPLLQRYGKRFELTQAGETLYRYGCRRQKEESELFHQLQNDDPYSGECRFACSGSLATFLYPHFLDYQKAHPDLTIKLEAAPNKRIIESLKANEIEVGIVTREVESDDIKQILIGQETLCLVVPSSFATEDVSLERLQQLGFINHPDGEHYLRQMFTANYNETLHNISSVKITGYINQLNQILLPVSQGLGFTVLPEKTVSSFPHQNKISVVTTAQAVSEALYLITKKHRPLPKRYEYFVDLIKKLF